MGSILSGGTRRGVCERIFGGVAAAATATVGASEVELTSLLPPESSGGGTHQHQQHGLGSSSSCTAAHDAPPPKYPLRDVVPAFWRHFRPFISRSMRGRVLSVATVVLCLMSSALSIWISYVSRDFQSALSKKDAEGFYLGIAKFVGVILIAIPLDSTFGYVQSHLALAWRMSFTERLLGQYFANQSFYRLSRPALQAKSNADGTQRGKAEALDNPDQRICQDVASFTGSSLMLLVLLFEKSLNLLGFAGVLWSISPRLVTFLIAYAAAGSYLSLRVFGRPIISSNAEMLRQEADLRYALTRVRENAEAIAFYRADGSERGVVLRRLALLLGTRTTLIWWQRCLTIFQMSYDYATVLVPTLILAPLYFRGDIDFGVIGQGSMAFRSVLSAMSLLVSRFDTIGGLVAETGRINALVAQLDREASAATDPSTDLLDAKGEGGTWRLSRQEVLESTSPPLELSQVSLWPPGDAVTGRAPAAAKALCRALSGVVQRGEGLLIVGPSGCGKSSLLRAIAGLWRRGQGTIRVAHHARVAFLPQAPYLSLDATLRQQLLFPHRQSGSEPGDEQMVQALHDVGLDSVQRRVGGLDAVVAWTQQLSPGEQQRLAVARLLLTRPRLAFLDEATSALDLPTEELVYRALRNGEVGKADSDAITLVSVGHRPSLLQFHSHVLSCERVAGSADELGAQWTWETTESYQRRLATDSRQ